MASRTSHQSQKTPTGLSSAEARARLAQEGYNELPSTRQRSTFAIAVEVAREPMFLLLIVSVAIYLALGDLREALVLSFSLFVIFGITIFQERKTERALEALRDLSSPRALVIRDGEQQRIAGREVARGDILILTEGDRVPADAVLLACNDLMVDESLLTGESVPVRKIASDGSAKATRPGGEDLPFVYSGTMLVQGRGVAQVLATGVNTEIGKIGKALQKLEPDETFLQKRSARNDSYLCGRRSFVVRRGDRSLRCDPGQLDEWFFSRDRARDVASPRGNSSRPDGISRHRRLAHVTTASFNAAHAGDRSARLSHRFVRR